MAILQSEDLKIANWRQKNVDKTKKEVTIKRTIFATMMNNFLKKHIAELHNVTWPTKNQAVHSMVTVVTIMFIVGVFLSVLDNVLGTTFLSFL